MEIVIFRRRRARVFYSDSSSLLLSRNTSPHDSCFKADRIGSSFLKKYSKLIRQKQLSAEPRALEAAGRDCARNSEIKIKGSDDVMKDSSVGCVPDNTLREASDGARKSIGSSSGGLMPPVKNVASIYVDSPRGTAQRYALLRPHSSSKVCGEGPPMKDSGSLPDKSTMRSQSALAKGSWKDLESRFDRVYRNNWHANDACNPRVDYVPMVPGIQRSDRTIRLRNLAVPDPDVRQQHSECPPSARSLPGNTTCLTRSMLTRAGSRLDNTSTHTNNTKAVKRVSFADDSPTTITTRPKSVCYDSSWRSNPSALLSIKTLTIQR